MSAALRVISPGALATIEDMGRPSARRMGVPGGGALDRFAFEAANRLVGNEPLAAAIEVTGGGAVFEVLTPLLLAIGGADLGAELDGWPLAPWVAALARPHTQLRLWHRRADWGARAYLAIGGGVAVPKLLGSRSTYLAGAFGGFAGRPLRAGDIIECGLVQRDISALAGRVWPVAHTPHYCAIPTVRIIRGPHAAYFSDDALAQLVDRPFRISVTSNRMGYRLEGARLAGTAPNVGSLGVLPGAIQVPPDGSPILLMADAQTTGGYPIVAVAIGADLPLAAQLLSGDKFRFAFTTQEQALDARRVQRAWLDAGPAADETQELLALAGTPGI